MQQSKLGLDFKKVDYAKNVSKKIAEDVQRFVENYTTVAVERTLCRLLGIDGVDENSVPLPNVLVDELKEKGVLSQGVMFFLGNAIIETKLNPQEIAEKVSKGELDVTKMAIHPKDKIEAAIKPYVDASMARVNARKARLVGISLCADLKRAWYTGQSEIPNNYALLMLLDYIKVGPYIAEKGPLNSKTTNQRLYKIEHNYSPLVTDSGSCATPVDITSRFWTKEEL